MVALRVGRCQKISGLRTLCHYIKGTGISVNVVNAECGGESMWEGVD